VEAEVREAAKALERTKVQAEARMKAADRGLTKCVTPAASKKAGSKSAEGRPWLDFTPAEHEELKAAVGEAQSAGNLEHLTYAERLRQAMKLIEMLDAHAAGKPMPPLPGSPGSPGLGGGSLPGSPPTVHSSQKESDVEKSMRKAGLALKMGSKGMGKAKEVRL
jgi:hypothetical protein